VNPSWIIVAIGVAGALVVVAASWLRRHRVVDLGTVSDHWVAERRLGQGHDTQH
jgi:hypothetical protein